MQAESRETVGAPSPLQEKQRRSRKERLAVAFRLFDRFGYSEGLLGHVTVRDPVRTDCFWVNPFGLHFGEIRVSKLLLADPEGRVLEGRGNVNRAAVAVHCQIHKARPDIIAIAHAHTLHGKSWSALGRKLDPINQEACCFFDDHALFAEYGGIALESEEGARIAETLGACKGVILQNHGLLTVGKSVEAAAWFFIMMDRCCQAQLLAEAAGEPKLIAPEIARRTRELNGTEMSGVANFAPWFSLLTSQEPDVLE